MTPRILADFFHLELPEPLQATADVHLAKIFLPYQKAPVVHSPKGQARLQEMNFSLVPRWSKTKRVKFATHNARLETVLEKPTWKKPFLSQRCLVPMSYFVEPIYTNELAGHMVRFQPKNRPLLVAAGVWDEWVDAETGEVLESFSILTDEPPPFVAEQGHDRCPVFLKPEAFSFWLDPQNRHPDPLMDILSEERDQPELEVKVDRPLKPGWEKRK